ncbi:MAG: SpoIIE family protein phosphatase [Treponema sp.]|nr:SpoIIE family protein phosphatase [Treponema sp.]
MFKAQRRLVTLSANIITGIVFFILVLVFLPTEKIKSDSPFVPLIFGAVVFFALFYLLQRVVFFSVSMLEKRILNTRETGMLTHFIDKLRFSYTVDDFIEVIQDVVEYEGDCSVLYVDRTNDYVIYNSPSRMACSEANIEKLEMNYSKHWPNGIYFIDREMGIVSNMKDARGFFLANNKKHLYVFCRYARLFDPIIYQKLIDEYARFEERTKIIASLSEIEELSKEWSLLAETQRSFLPKEMPVVSKLDLAAYFRPLVNVSGDYYAVLPIDEHKTLLMLGDVSGKGLAAALVMGLVMNTVKIMQNKEDLAGIVRAIDRAIKGMHLQDKYTVLFIGIVDTQKMTIRYINASMSDPIIVTQTPAGYKIKPLSSNCSLIGIIDLDDFEVAEQKLFRGDLILMASDGVSETMDDNGVELGNTDLYLETIQNSASKSAQHFVNDIANLVFEYNGNKRLTDDVTMLVAKVER